MSWAVEEWKDGLPGRALQKIQEMEVHLDKLKKERTQKQFQLDSLEAALQKQKQKADGERTESSAIKRENQALVESCDSLEKSRQKLAHDFGIKEQQVSYLEGQLNSCRKTIERLEQELKKYKNELERSQSAGSSLSSSSSELQPYTTPQKSIPTPLPVTANRQRDNRLDELQEKYNLEVDERKKLEKELKVLQGKLEHQSSAGLSHKDFAARQAGSSIFPWQQDQAHSWQIQDAVETPVKRRGASLWNVHEETPIKPSQRMSSLQSPAGSCQQMEQLKTLNQELRGRVSELERSLSTQQKDICNQASKLQELQTLLVQARKELTERDRDLTKTSQDLSQAVDRHQQAESKCSTVEQKLKQMAEEMSCQRHNAESCRRALEQKLKDQERASQKELAQLQGSHQTLEQQLDQTRNKLTQEIQQSKKDLNFLQADMEKMCFQKNQTLKEFEEQKQKLLRSEQNLQACQNKEHDVQKKTEELQKEKNSLTVQLDQSNRCLTQLEEEKKKTEQLLKCTQGLLDDLKAKSEDQTEELKRMRSKLEHETQMSASELLNMKKALCDAETRTERAQTELDKQKQEAEKLANRLTVLVNENQEQKSNVTTGQQECEHLKKEIQVLLDWKNEKETLINHTEAIQKQLNEKIVTLEKSLISANEVTNELKMQNVSVEGDKTSLSAHIQVLKGELLNKCTELEERDHQFMVLQAELSEVGEKHTKDLENVAVRVKQLEAQVEALEVQLKDEITQADQAKRINSELRGEHQAACDLVRSKDQLLELGQAEMVQLRESLSQAVAQQAAQGARLADERKALLTQCEETVSLKVEEIEQLKRQLEAGQQELLLFKDQVTSMELCTEVKEQLEAELQKQITKLSDQEEEHKMIYEGQSEEIRQLKDALKELRICLEDEQKLLSDSEAQISSLKKQNTETETLREAQAQETNSLLEQISSLQQELTVTQDAVKGLHFLNDELDMVNQSRAELKKCMEDLERSHSSTVEIKSNLENNLTEKTNLIVTLKVEVQKLKEQMCQDAESHAREINNCLNKQKLLQEQLDETKKIVTAAKAESNSRREEIKTMKTTLSAASQGLEERDDLIKILKEKLGKAEEEQARTSDLLKEKVVSMNKVKVQMEMLQMDLEDNETAMNAFDSQVEELKGTRDTLNSQLAQKQLQISDMEAKLEECKAQVSVLETRLEEVQSQNTLLEMQYITAREELTERSCEVTCLEEDAVKLSQLNETVATLQLKLGHIMEENIKLEMLRQTMEGKDSDINQLLQDKHVLETKVKQLIDEKEQVEANIIQVNALKNHLEASVNTLTEENQELQRRMKWGTEEKDKMDKVIKEKLEVQSSLRQVTEEKTQLAVTLSLLEQNKIQRETELKELAIKESDTVAKLNKVVDEKLQLSGQCDQLTKENIHLQSSLCKLAEDKLWLQESIQKFEKEMISLEDKNECIQSALLSSQQMVETLKEQLETRDKGDEEERRERSKQFEVQQAALHQQLLALQMELAATKQLYDSLLEQVSQQNGFIQQLSELQKTLKSEDNTSGRGCEKTESAGQMNADATHDASVESLSEMEQLSSEVAELKEHYHQSEEDFCETELVHKEHTGDKMMQECFDEAKNVCVPDPPETVEEQQHLQTTEALNTSLSALPSSSLPESSQSEVSAKASPQVRDDFNSYKNTITSQENQLQQLYAEFDLLKSDLMLRMELTSELQAEVQNWEKKFQRAEEEKLGALHKLNITLENHKVITDQVTQLSEEKEALTLQLQTSKCQLADVIEMLDGLQMTKGGWDENVLQLESELKRVRSEKTNLEQHILGMESDLETLQEERTKLKTEVEAQRKVCSGMEQQIETLTAELTQLRSELVSCSEERDDLNQSLGQWRNKVDSLEKTNCDTRNLISILEDDIRIGRREHQVLKTSIEKLASEKQQLLEQIKALELAISEQSGERQELIGQLDKITEDHTSAHQNTETMVGKIQTLEGEVYHLSQSLEASLVEKGEIASRLNSTQDEVQQMRTDIEKLCIRIESDERKKKKMGELLKAQRKSDSLQDRIDALVREQADIEASLEEAVLQADTSKEELKEEKRKVEEEKMELSNKLSEFSDALQHLRSEKKHMELELELKNKEIENLKAAKEEVERGLERAEVAKRQEEERHKHRVEQLEKEVKEDAERRTRQLDDLQDQLQACHQRELYLEGKSIEMEADKKRMKSLLAEMETDKKHLQTLLEELQTGRDGLCSQTAEWEREMHNLKTDINTLKDERNNLILKIRAKEEERENLKTTMLSEKESLQISLVSLQGEKERIEQESQVLVFDKEKLQSHLCLIEKEKQEMQQIFSSLKEEKDSIEEERNKLASEREKLLSLLSVVEKEKNELTSITSLEQENQNVEEVENLTGDQGRLWSTVASVQEQLEMCKPSVSRHHEPVSDLSDVVTRLSKEKDSALSKMSLWMKTCKQLEREKEVMLNSIEEVKNKEAQLEISQLQREAEKTKLDMEDLKKSLQQKKNEAGEQTKEVDELKAALSGKKQELMERNGELQELKNELTELKNLLEMKSTESDESIDKYCNLMVQVHKLEETNAALTTRLEQLSAGQKAKNGKGTSGCVQHRWSARKLAIKPREEIENAASSTPLRIPQGSKRGHSDLSEKDSPLEALPDLDLTKKLKTNLVNAAQEETDQEEDDFRPEGLPELVQKGFADIPVGEASPFIIRRTTVKHCSPQLGGRHSGPTPVCKVLGPVSVQSPSTESHMCHSPKQRPQSLGRTPGEKEKPIHQGDNCHVQ